MSLRWSDRARALGCLALFCADCSWAAAPAREAPILRIEAGMHTGLITSIALDASRRYLVTGSLDKTARVWDLGAAPLRPETILRPPIGPGKEGALYAVAISPDGATVACGGYTGTGSGATALYIFDRRGGELKARVPLDARGVVNGLAYSKDGRHLAVALGAKDGIRVLRTEPAYGVVAGDADYGGAAYSVDFASDGRLVSAAYDGRLRLYDAGYAGGSLSGRKRLSPMATWRDKSAREPREARFSPDGKKLAVAFSDEAKVVVLNGGDLSFGYAPESGGLNGALSSVAWSEDGAVLIAGGKHAVEQAFVLRGWSGAGKLRGDQRAAGDTITGILPLEAGEFVFSSADPALGVLDASGGRRLFSGPVAADPRGNRKGFGLSDDGSTVAFAYRRGGQDSAWFSVFGRELGRGAPPSPLPGPVTESQELAVTGWKNSYRPALNGRPLKLEADELSRCLAIAPDGAGFALGTEHRLRRFDKDGRRLWEVSAPGAVWAVNIARNAPLVAAALGDGTIRWYAWETGAELLALFAHGDGRRWVLWTPSGYYDASIDGDRLVGWHLGRGPDKAASFHEAGRFRSLYHAPKVVAEILDLLDEDKAVSSGLKKARRELDASVLPPLLELAGEPTVSGGTVTARYRLREESGAPAGGGASIKVLLDARPVHEAAASGPDGELRFFVSRPAGTLSFIVKNRHAAGRPVSVALGGPSAKAALAQAKPAPGRAAAGAGPGGGGLPKLWILAVGVSRYADRRVQPLSFAHADAQEFVDSMRKQQGRLYRKVEAGRPLLNELATRRNIEEGLTWLRDRTGADDVGIVFMSSHGTSDDKGNYYFLSHDADMDRLDETGLLGEKIRDILTPTRGKMILFLDSCHSGNVMGLQRGMSVDRFVNDLASPEHGVVVFTASTGSQSSYEFPRCKHGIFTQALIEGVEGWGAYNKEEITVASLDDYVWGKVRDAALKVKIQQTPASAKPFLMPNFPLALRLPEEQRAALCVP